MRHSVEVTTGVGGYQHIRPNNQNRSKCDTQLQVEGAITEESMTSSGNSETTENPHQSSPANTTSSNEGQTVTFLPPALSCMVRLWDEITLSVQEVNFYIRLKIKHWIIFLNK